MIVSKNISQKRNKKNQLITELLYLIVIVGTIYNSNSFYNTVNTTIGFILLIVSIASLFLLRTKITKNALLILFVLITIILINMVLTGNQELLMTNVRFIAVISLGVILADSISFDDFVCKYINIIFWLSLIGLIVFAVINIFGFREFLYKLPTLTNVNGVTAYDGGLFLFYNYRQDRLMSIFWEPSIYSTYVNLAIVLEICFKKNISVIKMVILVLGVFASKSTGGYLVLLIVFILFLLVRIEKSKLRNIGIFVLISVCVIIYFEKDAIIELLIKINPKLFYKLDLNNDSISAITRLDSILLSLKIFFNYPILGVGFGNVENIAASMGAGTGVSTPTYFMAAFGLLGGIYSFLVVRGFLKQHCIGIAVRLVFLAIFLVMIIKEPYWYSVFMYAFITLLNKNNLKLKSI